MMRHELRDMVALADRIIASDEPGTLATLFAARGPTYRPLGSMMVCRPGMQAGAISGGFLEQYVAREGALATATQPAAILTFSTAHGTGDRAPVLGQGGAIDILVERLTSAQIVWLKELWAAASANSPSVIQCRVQSSGSVVEVHREWLHACGRTANIPSELEHICRQVLLDKESCHVPLGVTDQALMYYVPAVSRLVIFGAGEDSRPLCDLGRLLGWHVTVAERRSRLATVAAFSNADSVLTGEWHEILGSLQITSHNAIVLMTHSLEEDASVLALLAEKSPSYVGALGPARRREWLLEQVAARGA